MTDIFQPTNEQRTFVVDSLESGLTYKEVYEILKITEPTFTKHFEYEKLTSKALLLNSATKVIKEAVKGGSLDAAKFVLSKRGDAWKDSLNVTSDDGSMSPRRTLSDFYADIPDTEPKYNP